MKKVFHFTLFLLFSFLFTSSFAGINTHLPPSKDGQDTIVLRSGVEMYVNFIEIKEGKVYYKKSENAPISYIGVSQIAQIKHADGKTEAFNGYKEPPMQEKAERKLRREKYNQALMEVHEKYKPTGAFTFTLFISFLTGGTLGLIPVGIYASTLPQDSDTGLSPDADLEYKDCYRQEARKMRTKSVWRGYGIGLLLAVVAGIIIFIR